MGKTIKTKSERVLRLNTPEEEAAINAGIAADPDTYELTEEEIREMRPFKMRGRPVGSGNKEQVTLRIDKETLNLFRETGVGWQTRINAALKNVIHSGQDLSKL
ncbi:MAG: BrnA antitoxin family protein [Alistipes senegalensis]|nr:BrnA antitoxin family protein [Oxalobacter formigenes]MCM1280891.1 BrnA antitoxin family protein [Alistipes senegalensis]